MNIPPQGHYGQAPLPGGWAEGLLPASENSETNEKYQQLLSAIGRFSLHEAHEGLSTDQIARSWEQNRIVKEAPRFAEQAADETRQTKFRFMPTQPKTLSGQPELTTAPISSLGPLGETATEHEGLVELRNLLTAFITRKKPQESSTAVRAVDILDNLTFIGEKEYQEAAAGIGVAWRAYLDADPRRQLCIVTEINRLDRYEGQRKSDEHLKDQVLASFTDEELERYSGRIVDSLDDLQTVPEHGRIILLDDWSITGKQMRDTYGRLMDSPTFQTFAGAGKVEVNLLVASADRIRNGLPISVDGSIQDAIPVRSYYQAHHAYTANETGYSCISGLHSSVNYGFSWICGRITSKAQKREGLPKMANIMPTYRDQVASVVITGRQLRRKASAELIVDKAVAQAGTLAVTNQVRL